MSLPSLECTRNGYLLILCSVNERFLGCLTKATPTLEFKCYEDLIELVLLENLSYPLVVLKRHILFVVIKITDLTHFFFVSVSRDILGTSSGEATPSGG